MLRFLVAFLFSFTLMPVVTAQTRLTLTDIRREFAESIESSRKTDQLHEKLSGVARPEPLVVAYRGATEALKARFAWNPYYKMQHLKKSQTSFNEAIAAAPADLEIRFLRFSILHHLPGFLVESKDLEADRKVIVNNITSAPLDAELRRVIGRFMLESGRCTAQEEAIIQKAII